MKALRFCVLKRFVASCTCQPNNRKYPRVCQYSKLAAEPGRKWRFFSDDSEGESSVYKHALKFQRPSTVKYRAELENCVSLIGRVDYALKRCNTHDGSLGVHTKLSVKTSYSSHSVRVLLKMWNEMAEVSIKYIKPNDLVYVCGQLSSYIKTDENGDPRMYHEVVVEEINYVADNIGGKTYPIPEKLDLQGKEERYRNRLHLWHVFFANPYEWTDFRKTKTNPKQPDFKHKSTGEALWLSPHDPPWLKRQLEFLDPLLRRKGLGGDTSSTSCTLEWNIQ